MKLYIRAATLTPRDVKRMYDAGELENHKGYEVDVLNRAGRLLTHNYLDCFTYQGKYYIYCDLHGWTYARGGGEARNRFLKEFDNKNQANAYFKKLIQGKQYRRVE